MKYSFVINPAAGKGKIAAGLAEKIKEVCEARELDFDIYFTKGVGDATEYVRRTGEERTGPIRFYACGGDGTFGEAAQGVMAIENREGVSLGLFPIGTGNDFVRNFTEKEAFLDVAAQIDGETRDLDVLRCNDRYAMNVINVGFDCEVVCDTVRYKKSPLIPSSMVYIAALVTTLVRKPGVSMKISVDGGEPQEKQLLLTTFANGAFYGGGFHSNPLAVPTDGQIDGLMVSDVTRRKFIMLVGDYKKGTHLSPKFEKILTNYKCHTADVFFDKETNVSVDGEVIRFKELHLSVLPKALSFVIPKGADLRVKEQPTPEIATV